MLFQESTPDTSGYMIAGYVIAFLVMALYVASIYLRHRNLKQDLTTLQEMEKPVQTTRSTPARQARKSLPRSENHRSVKPVTKKSIKK